MRTEIVIPQLGLMETATVVEWLRNDGDRVAKGDPLVVVETDKANAEIESPADGLLEIAVPAGSEPVPAEVVLGHIDDRADPA
jgi:pyruvate/2-oxoglutarate dehydrogenase complex dihydrolipoamide acyltransferase (E2) component